MDEPVVHKRSEVRLIGSASVLYGFIGLVLTAMVGRAMWRHSSSTVGFRFLFSSCVGDFLLIIQFAVWPGIVILMKQNIFPTNTRWLVHVYLDFTWWVLALHYGVIAWSRFEVMRRPAAFRRQKRRVSLLICVVAWIGGAVISLGMHLLPFFQIMHLSPNNTGFIADNFTAYNDSGTPMAYLVVNVLLHLVVPLGFYCGAVCQLTRLKSRIAAATTSDAGSDDDGARSLATSLSVEKSLMIPCVINNIVFIAGQALIMQSDVMTRMKYFGWFVLMVFTTKSFLNPVLYLVFSPLLRQEVLLFIVGASSADEERQLRERILRANEDLFDINDGAGGIGRGFLG